MTATLLADRDVAKVYHATWEELLEVVPRCDALIVDAPYSERTHAGHDEGSTNANEGEKAWLAKNGLDDKRSRRRGMPYKPWGQVDVDAFVDAWSPRTDGWFVSITDHMLAPHWAAAFERHERYVFAPIPYVEPGSRPRLSGDGPASWTCWVMLSRPKSRAFASWGSMPGAYLLPRGNTTIKTLIGGKTPWLMERLVEDYSRPGQLVVDPCCGAGTTVTAAIRTGRRAIGGDAMREHAQLAAAAIEAPQQLPMFLTGAA